MDRIKQRVSVVAGAVLALGALTVGVAAQDDGAPTELTAEWGFTDAGCCVEVEPASDPRFLGDVSARVSMDEHATEAGALAVWSRAFSVRNDEGSWRGIPHTVIFQPDGTASDITQVFVGEGAFEGLYAVVETETTPGAGGGVVLDGYILEGTPPAQ